MRIGEFSKSFGSTNHTVRHYMELGLLIPEKDGEHFKFSGDDMRDMEHILFLKSLGFSLKEIQDTLSHFRLSGKNRELHSDPYIEFLSNKKEALIQERKNTSLLIQTIQQEIQRCQSSIRKEIKVSGVPLASLPLFCCPICGGSLVIEGGKIEEQNLLDGQMKCKDCTYRLSVRNGIVINDRSVRQKELRGCLLPNQMEYLKAASSSFINFRYKSMELLSQKMEEIVENPQYILELNFCIGTFFKHYQLRMPHSATYFLVEYDLDRLQAVKRDLEESYPDLSVVYLCCDVRKLPIRANTFDMMVDYWLTKDYGKEHHTDLVDDAIHFLKEDGVWAAVLPYIEPDSPNYSMLNPSYRKYFEYDRWKTSLRKNDLIPLYEEHIGPVIENNPYNYDIQEQEVFQAIYLGRREM